MSSYFPIWLVGFALLAAFCFFAKGEKRKLGERILIAFLAIFILQAVFNPKGRQEQIATASLVLDGERSDLMMRFDYAIGMLEKQLAAIVGKASDSKAGIFSTQAISYKRQGQDLSEEAERMLKQGLSRYPQSSYLKSRLAVLLFNAGGESDISAAADLLADLTVASGTKEAPGVLSQIYLQKPEKAKVSQLANKVEEIFPSGWYRDITLLKLYAKGGAEDQYRSYELKVNDKAAGLILHICIVLAAAFFLVVGGMIIWFIQLAFVGRNRPAESKLPDLKPLGDMRLPVVVLIAWMATQVFVSSISGLFSRFISGASATALALTVAITYLVENAPGWFYMYWLAFRPKGIKFIEGIGLSKKYSGGQIFQLILMGIGTWVAAVPLVLAAFAVSSWLLGTQGSQNPIIALLIQISRSSNFVAAGLFYLTLGVFAPLCEEPLFRGFLYRSIKARYGIALGIAISALLFAALHLDPGGMLPLFALGVVFAYAFEKTGSLIPSIVAHGLWNSTSFTLSILLFSW